METYFKLKLFEEIIGYIILGVVLGIPILLYIINFMVEKIKEFFDLGG